MRLHTSIVTRGSGKVYTLLRPYVEGVSAWGCTAHTAEGQELPCKVVELEGARQVLVTPVLSTSVHVHIVASDAAGKELASGDLLVRVGLSKRLSQFNTLMKNQRAEAIRNCDCEWQVKDAHFEVLRIITSPTLRDRVHFMVTYSDVSPAGERVPIEAMVLDSTGHPIRESSLCILGDASYDYPDTPDIRCRRVLFSASIPEDLPSFVLWVRDASSILPEGFHCVEDFVVRELRTTWNEQARLFAEFDPRYHEWFEEHRTTAFELEIQRKAAGHFLLQPSFSIVVPLFHTPLRLFKEMAESVLSQTYPQLELILVNSTPEDGDLSEAIATLMSGDERVKLVELTHNLGITGNTYEGVKVCQGDFVAFLDHDDVIEPDLLYWYVKGINDYPTTDLLYCDEDKLEGDRYLFPFFKPDYDPFFLETNNYICHMLTIRRLLLQERPSFDSDLDGAQDHALTLWAGSRARNVYHARKILYHWRIHESSSANDKSAKPTSTAAGKRAVDSYFARSGIQAHAELIDGLANRLHIRYEWHEEQGVTVVLYGASNESEKQAAQAALYESQLGGTLAQVIALPGPRSEVAAAINAVVGFIATPFVLLAPAGSMPVSVDWLNRLMDYACRKGVEVVAPLCTHIDGTVKDRGVVCAYETIATASGEYLAQEDGGAWFLNTLAHQVSAVHGGVALMRRDMLAQYPLDEDMPAGLWDVDFCLGARSRGGAVVLVPESQVAVPLGAFELQEDRRQRDFAWRGAQARLRHRWPRLFSDTDPFYSFQLHHDGSRRIGEDGYRRLLLDTFPNAPLTVDAVIPDRGQDTIRISTQAISVNPQASAPTIELLGDHRGAMMELDKTRRELTAYPGMWFMRRIYSARVPFDSEAGLSVLISDETSVGTRIDFTAEDLRHIRAQWPGSTPLADADWDYYDAWLEQGGRSGARQLSLQAKAQTHFTLAPAFSVVVPLFRTPLSFFEEMVQSVIQQTYPHWELVLVNASPDDEELCAAIQAYCSQDLRIRCLTLEDNYGITENTKVGIEATTGDFVCLLDHDDTIEPDALYWYAHAVNHYPDTDLIYCDEDKLLDGRYVSCFLKPDWDPQLLCHMNYVTHMLCMRRILITERLDLVTSEYDGSQDHHMTFLVGEVAHNVYHVRRVLYHWRMHAQSTAGAGTAQKSYAIDAERKAVQAHLDRCGIPGAARMRLEPVPRCLVDRPGEHVEPLVSIIIPSHDAAGYLSRCVESIFCRTTWSNYEIVIVENGSVEPETFELYERLRHSDHEVCITECSQPDGFNFSLLINHGVSAAHGDYLLLLNNDTEVLTPTWIGLMMAYVLHEGAGCVGAKLLYPDDLVQHVGVMVGRSFCTPQHIDYQISDTFDGYYECDAFPHRLSAVTGACLLTSRRVFEEVGGLDEDLFVNYNDVDYCLRVRAAGYPVVEQVDVKLRHFESVSRGFVLTRDQRARFNYEMGTYGERWLRYLVDGDPYYNTNFGVNNGFHQLLPR